MEEGFCVLLEEKTKVRWVLWRDEMAMDLVVFVVRIYIVQDLLKQLVNIINFGHGSLFCCSWHE